MWSSGKQVRTDADLGVVVVGRQEGVPGFDIVPVGLVGVDAILMG